MMKAIVGCLALLAWFALVALLMLGTMMAECFPGMGHTCPTDHERNLRLLTILFGGIGIYLLVGLAIAYVGRWSDERNEAEHGS